MADTLGERIAAVAARTDLDALPADVVDSVAQRVLDVCGLCLAASDMPTSAAALTYVEEQGGRPQAHVIGRSDRVPAPLAAFANGVLAHSLDFDDTHLPSVLHPSASVVPAALAAAEYSGADGARTTAAIAVGIEVCVRLGMAGFDPETGNSVFFHRGQHATSICGTLGGAVAAAMLLGLDEHGILDALGIAASTASGVIEANRTGGTVKRVHCGWAAHAALSAAQLARHGITGPPTILEGRFGFFEAFIGGVYDTDAITDGLGTKWTVPSVFFKPYPANHFTHTAVDAARALRDHGLRAADVRDARLLVAEPMIRTIGEPLDQKRCPETAYQAQFSGPYAVTVGLMGAGPTATLADYTEELARDPERRALMAKVTVEPDPRCTGIFPYQFPAILVVRTTDGRELVEEVLTNLGGPDRPLSDDALAAKFRANAAGRLSPERIEAARHAVRRLPDLSRAAALLEALVREPGRETTRR